MVTLVTIQRESWQDLRPVIMPLWQRHNDEIAAPVDRELLDPDWNYYDGLADLELDHWVGVRLENRELVGYGLAIVRPHPHRNHTLSAFYDLYWLAPEYRKRAVCGNMPAGIRLMQFMEDTLWERGVRKQYLGTKAWMDISKLLKRNGWVETERLFTKAIN